ncbi:hypothetical protein LV779_34725 [Streptomyces thinghirensis]|nr:hypothetical protein [Streptomyces thinghirensis]
MKTNLGHLENRRGHHRTAEDGPRPPAACAAPPPRCTTSARTRTSTWTPRRSPS